MKDKLPPNITAMFWKASEDQMMSVLPKVMASQAKMQFVKFKELKAAGFTIPEALELCKGSLFLDLNTFTGKKDS